MGLEGICFSRAVFIVLASDSLVRNMRVVLVEATKTQPKECFAEVDAVLTPVLSSANRWVFWKMTEYVISAVCRQHREEKKKESGR